MENFSYSSYPDSHDSSPRSREIDCENAAWEETPSNYKVKFMCSYGGKIQPRAHDNQLAYVGGDTKILSADRSIRFGGLISKLSSICDVEVCFKYQLPGEDLDALISVTNDEDLEHMMMEYDRLYRGSAKPARLRLFLFPLTYSNQSSFSSDEPKSNQQWFVEALNSAPNQSLESPSPPAPVSAASNPDFLFGLERGLAAAPPPAVAKPQDPVLDPPLPEPVPAKIPLGSDSGRDDRHIGVEQVVIPQAEIHRQMQEFHRMQIASQEQQQQLQQQQHHQQQQQQQAQTLYQRKSEENMARAFAGGDYYVQKLPERPPQPNAVQSIPAPAPAPAPATVSVPTGYWQDRHVTSGGYATPATGADQPVYLIPAPAGMYHAPSNVRPVTGPVGQGYYGMQQRVMQDVYREQPAVYSMAPPPPAAVQQQQQPSAKVLGGVPVPEAGYAQVGYDSAGRQVYYTAGPPGGMVPPPYQGVPATGPLPGQQVEGKLMKPSQASV